MAASKTSPEVKAVRAERRRIVRYLRWYAKQCRDLRIKEYDWAATAVERAADNIAKGTAYIREGK